MTEAISALMRVLHALVAPSLLTHDAPGAASAALSDAATSGSSVLLALGLVAAGAAAIALAMGTARVLAGVLRTGPSVAPSLRRASPCTSTRSPQCAPDAPGKPRPRAPGRALVAA